MQQPKLNLFGTATGRFSSNKPNPPSTPVDMRNFRPKGTPIRPYFSLWSQPDISHSIRNILNIDYAKLERRAWASHYKYDFWKTVFGCDTAKPYSYEPKPTKDIYVMNRPIELNQMETFRVEISFPQPGLDTQIFITQTHLQPACSCEMRILMREGCQCGGV